MVVGLCENWGVFEYRIWNPELFCVQYVGEAVYAHITPSEEREDAQQLRERGIPIYKDRVCVQNRLLVVVAYLPELGRFIVVDTASSKPFVYTAQEFSKVLQTYKCYNAKVTDKGVRIRGKVEKIHAPKLTEKVIEQGAKMIERTAVMSKRLDVEFIQFINEMLAQVDKEAIPYAWWYLLWQYAGRFNCNYGLRIEDKMSLFVDNYKLLVYNAAYQRNTFHADLLICHPNMCNFQVSVPNGGEASMVIWNNVTRLLNSTFSWSCGVYYMPPKLETGEVEGCMGSLNYMNTILTMHDNMKGRLELLSRLGWQEGELEIMYIGRNTTYAEFPYKTRKPFHKNGDFVILSKVAVCSSWIERCAKANVTIYCLKDSEMYRRICLHACNNGGKVIQPTREEYEKVKNRLFAYASDYNQPVEMPELLENVELPYIDSTHTTTSVKREADIQTWLPRGLKIRMGVLESDPDTAEYVKKIATDLNNKYVIASIAKTFGGMHKCHFTYIATRTKWQERDCNILADEYVRTIDEPLAEYLFNLPLNEFKIMQTLIVIGQSMPISKLRELVKEFGEWRLEFLNKIWDSSQLACFLIGFDKLWAKIEAMQDENADIRRQQWANLKELADAAACCFYNTAYFLNIAPMCDKNTQIREFDFRAETQKMLDKYTRRYLTPEELYAQWQTVNKVQLRQSHRAGEWAENKTTYFELHVGRMIDRYHTNVKPCINTTKLTLNTDDFRNPERADWVIRLHINPDTGKREDTNTMQKHINRLAELNKLEKDMNDYITTSKEMRDKWGNGDFVKNLGDYLWVKSLNLCADRWCGGYASRDPVSYITQHLTLINYFNPKLAELMTMILNNDESVKGIAGIDKFSDFLRITAYDECPTFPITIARVDPKYMSDKLWIFYNSGGMVWEPHMDFMEHCRTYRTSLPPDILAFLQEIVDKSGAKKSAFRWYLGDDEEDEEW